MNRDVADAVRGIATIAVNSTFYLAPSADLLVARDAAWWLHHRDEALRFAGVKVCADDAVPFRAVRALRWTGREGFDGDTGNVRGDDSGAIAAHVAAHAGASRILLCGIDLDGVNWHGAHPAPLRTSDAAALARMRRSWETLAPALAERGIEVINCSLRSALACFPKRSLDEVLPR